MRRASFVISRDGQRADVLVASFPGEVGGLLANVNRWRGQVGLGPIGAEALKECATPMRVGGHDGHWIDARGETRSAGGPVPQRIIAVICVRDGHSWFFKIQGGAPLVDHEEENFRGFIGSVAF